jgi:L-ascorbate metabolism protein UlaG (beta-lactamase superfamily)
MDAEKRPEPEKPIPAGAPDTANEGSAGWKFAENNRRLAAFHKAGGDPAAPGRVTIEYFAHSAFRLTSPGGLTAIFDPWRNDPSGAWGLWFPRPFPEAYADIAISTHAHFDHDAVHRVHAPVVLERPVGAFALGDMRLTCFGDKHMYRSKGSYRWTEVFGEAGVALPPDNPMHLDNSIIHVETGGLRVVVWGDNRPDPEAHIVAALKGIDVLILPLDGSEHILTAEDAANLRETLAPRVMIPCHYRTGSAVSVLSTLQTADAWVDSMPSPLRLRSPSWSFSAGDIKHFSGKAVYFGDHFLTA